ncbi:hypothetical protein DFH27DRAFT_189279 [Peziza echinospora]|nr:hypothetical protein DFH27DRAFT_189279 [Peziza echinospora]
MPGLQTSAMTSPPSLSHYDKSGAWEYAVPLEHDQYPHGSAPSSVKSRGQTYDNTPTQSRSNGYGTSSRAASGTHDPSGFLDPKTIRRQESNISSNQDGDSVLDLYGGRLSTMDAREITTARSENGDLTDEESKWIDSEKLARIEGRQLEYSRWIDRDKLEMIEIEELEQAGIRLPLKARGSFNMLQESHQPGSRPMERSRTSSGSSAPEEDERFYNPNEPSNDLRLPSEQLFESHPHPMRLGQRNGSSSRIPLYTSSPLPVRQQYIERAAPLIRPGPSPDQGSDDDSISYIRSRKRSHSAGSAVLLAENTPSTTLRPSAKNARTQSHNTSNAGTPGRSPSKTNPRQSNNTKNKNRPPFQVPTSPHRPGTANYSAPEGPPPWSLSTYSPDPKLPPDQQIIPTVAKRLQQEQWEKDGVFATVYDGKLRPLKVPDPSSLPRPIKRESPSSKETESTADATADVEWPLRSPTLAPSVLASAPSPEPEERSQTPSKDAPSSFNSRTPTTVNGRNVSQSTTTRNSQLNKPAVTPLRVPVEDEKNDQKKEKKKFACCIVM